MLVGAMALAYALGFYQYLSFESIGRNYAALRDLIASHFLLALAGYMVVYVAAVAVSVPCGSFLTVAGGLLFGWQAGAAAAVVSATAGATLLFLIVKHSFGPALAPRASRFITRLKEGFAENGLCYMLFLRLVPLFPFCAVNVVPALLNVPLSTFVLGTAIGIVPATIAFALTGSGIGGIIAAQNEAYRACLANAATVSDCRYTIDPGTLINPELMVAIAALGVITLLPAALKAWSKGNATTR
jgi:uncharacterized membrane protein YdjX (TVP38/TMEM64 family)